MRGLESAVSWKRRMLSGVPAAWRQRIDKIHATRAGKDERTGNLWLADVADKIKRLKVPIDLSDSEIIAMANKCAREAMDLAGVGLMTMEAYRERLNRFCSRYSIIPPEPEKISKAGNKSGFADAQAIRRMTDDLWWRRKLRQVQARALEGQAIELGYVHKRAEIYASNVTVERRAQQRARNAAMLEGTQAINLTTAEIFTLAELAERSVSVPRIRRGELMTRIAGFEGIATGLDHAAEFITLTTPSRFHPKKQVSNGAVIDNPKWSGSTPREAQKYLGKVWAACRAKLNRYGIRVYGFRIAEPHHDGTPHWHGLFFMPRWYRPGASMVSRFRAIVRRYFLREDSNEAGARSNRCKFVAIDAAKGTAAGYIAKYVAKNIDGFQVQQDLEGENLSAVTGSQRVEAWAATWGIRQFQQVGGPPVGVWRELRRIPDKIEASDTVEAARSAADAGNWRRYVEIMGGPVVKREDLPLRTAYTREGERWDAIAQEPQPAPLTRYGDIAKGAVYGVRDIKKDKAFISRIYQWEIRRAVGFDLPRTRVNNCTQGEKGNGRGESNGMGDGSQICGFAGDGNAGGVDYLEATAGFDRRAGGNSGTNSASPEPAGFRH